MGAWRKRGSGSTVGKFERSELVPEKAAIKRAQRDKRQGKSPSTQAGEFVREEMHHIREGEHGAKSARQAIAIGLNKARRAGVALKGEPRAAASHLALSRQAHAAAKSRTRAQRSAAAKKAARTRARTAH
jgi:hypothetical protein